MGHFFLFPLLFEHFFHFMPTPSGSFPRRNPPRLPNPRWRPNTRMCTRAPKIRQHCRLEKWGVRFPTKTRIFIYTIYASFDYVIKLSYISFFFLCSYFEAMFRSFMPEDNTVTVSKIQFIGDKNWFFFNELRVSLMTETDFSLNSVLHRIPTQQTWVHNVVVSDPLYQTGSCRLANINLQNQFVVVVGVFPVNCG